MSPTKCVCAWLQESWRVEYEYTNHATNRWERGSILLPTKEEALGWASTYATAEARNFRVSSRLTGPWSEPEFVGAPRGGR